MPWQLLAHAAVSKRQWGVSHQRRLGRLAILSIVAAFLQGCAAPLPSPSVGPDPSNPAAPAPRVGYRSTIAPFTSMRPVEPAAWQKQNDRVAPAPHSSH